MNPVDYYSDEYVGKGKQKRQLTDREFKSIELIKKLNLPNNKKTKFLDLACGDAFFTRWLTKKESVKFSFYGCDFSKDRLRNIDDIPNMKLKQMNFEEGLKYPKNLFDIVYAAEIIEHLYNTDRLVEEIYRILKPGGYLIITTPNLNCWINRLIFLLGNQPLFLETSTKSSLIGMGFLKHLKKQEAPVGHLRIFNKDSIKDILEFNKLKIVNMKGGTFDVFPNILNLIDRIFSLFPKYSCNMIVLAKK